MPMREIAFGRWSEDTFHPNAFKCALAEFISTFLFVFAGEGSVLAYDKLSGDGALTPSGLVGVALSHGCALFVSVAISANISGGHVNPAVTFALFVGGYITFLKTILYCIAQLLGAAIAALLLKLVTGGMTTPPPGLSTGEAVHAAVLLEIIATFGLVYTVYATAVDPCSKGNISITAPLAIGLIVAANVLFAGAFDGGAMNPARAFGPALVAWNWENQWVYWVGPLVGGVLAGVVYELFFMQPQPQPQPQRETLLSQQEEY